MPKLNDRQGAVSACAIASGSGFVSVSDLATDGFIFRLEARDLGTQRFGAVICVSGQNFRPGRTSRPFPAESAVVILLVSLLRY
jgi:hypothetical protein